MIEDFEPVEQRECDDKFNWPDKAVGDLTLEKTREKFTEKLLRPFRYVFLMGLSCTGKSTFMDAYPGRKNWSCTCWSRDPIMDMIFLDGRRVDKYYQYLDALEQRLFQDLFERDKHQILIESWMSAKGTRTKYLNYMPDNLGRVAAIVFDGPTDMIIDRALENEVIDKPESEVKMFLEDKHDSFDWPERDEGFHSIYYINTFDTKGSQYLSKVLE